MLKAIKRFFRKLYKKPINPFINFWKNFSIIILLWNCWELSKQLAIHRDRQLWQGNKFRWGSCGGHPRILTKDEINQRKNDNPQLCQ